MHIAYHLKGQSFEWDSVKSDRNLLERGFGFELACEAVLDPHHLSVVDNRQDYGEVRKQVLGAVSDDLTTVVLLVVTTDRSGVIRIISARKANKRERGIYEQTKQSTTNS